jgi:hypothetical protein
MHRKDLVIRLRGEELLFGLGKLQTDEHCLNAASDEKEHSRDEIAVADLLMVDGAQPAPEAGRTFPKMRETLCGSGQTPLLSRRVKFRSSYPCFSSFPSKKLLPPVVPFCWRK